MTETATTTMTMGLDALGTMALSPRGQAALEAAGADNGGRSLWTSRKLAEARELIALSELAPRGRMRIDYLDLSDEFRALIHLGVRAPYRDAAASRDDSVRIADSATIGLVYPEKALTEQLHGFAYVQLVAPRNAWHPAIASMSPFPQVLCLGDVPAGMRTTELVLMAYAGLAMQNVRLDAFETVGAMNVQAGQWWADHVAELPLTRLAFLEAD